MFCLGSMHIFCCVASKCLEPPKLMAPFTGHFTPEPDPDSDIGSLQSKYSLDRRREDEQVKESSPPKSPPPFSKAESRFEREQRIKVGSLDSYTPGNTLPRQKRYHYCQWLQWLNSFCHCQHQSTSSTVWSAAEVRERAVPSGARENRELHHWQGDVSPAGIIQGRKRIDAQ